MLKAGTESKRVIRRIAALFVFTVVVTFVCAGLMYAFERHAPDTQITSFGTALYWSAAQLLTLGSPLDDPVSIAGRVLSVFMDVYAVVIIGTLSGTLGAYFLHRIDVRLGVAPEATTSDDAAADADATLPPADDLRPAGHDAG